MAISETSTDSGVPAVQGGNTAGGPGVVGYRLRIPGFTAGVLMVMALRETAQNCRVFAALHGIATASKAGAQAGMAFGELAIPPLASMAIALTGMASRVKV
jgi:hypothetical protein